MGKKKRAVPASQGEAKMAKKAEKMKEAGQKSFSSVYGDTTSGSFNPAADAAQMTQAMAQGGMLTPDQHAQLLQQAEALAQSAPQGQPEMPVQPPQDQPEQPAQKPQEAPPQLPKDPLERCQYLSGILGRLSKNPPQAEQLLQWKQIHGDIYLLNVAERAFVFRYLKRQEWIQIQANPQLEQMTEMQMEEMIFNRCVLWPRLEPLSVAALPANTMGMVVEQIRIQSLFLDPGYVATLTLKI